MAKSNACKAEATKHGGEPTSTAPFAFDTIHHMTNMGARKHGQGGGGTAHGRP